MLPERADEGRSSTHTSQRATRMTTQLREVLCTEVGELILFPVAPYVFEGVEFRRVCRESFQRDATALLRYELLDQSATVSRKPIPNDEKIATDVAHQVAQEFHHLRAFDRSRVQAEIEGPPRDARDDRERTPVEVNRGESLQNPAIELAMWDTAPI